MLLIQVLGINVLTIIIISIFGWLPVKYIESRAGAFHPGLRLFSSVFLGYLLAQSLYAIWITNGMTMQILNFLPFVLLRFLPAQTKNTSA
jgi:hypothetical protein